MVYCAPGWAANTSTDPAGRSTGADIVTPTLPLVTSAVAPSAPRPAGTMNVPAPGTSVGGCLLVPRTPLATCTLITYVAPLGMTASSLFGTVASMTATVIPWATPEIEIPSAMLISRVTFAPSTLQVMSA